MGASRATICLRAAGQSVGPHFAGSIDHNSNYRNGVDPNEREFGFQKIAVPNSADGLKNLD